ncbi:hypothetical protein [Paenibacillus sonchi]|uniref:hypothetical protein n=1 Tax=Paenibacillus sonchi TaxID=373687 RepID=UPI001E28C26F|nr:hypothetical protein [Paenibacillus sonchi]MCE3199131.1 hypothetical protein [Paenibacillus sonchi]
MNKSEVKIPLIWSKVVVSRSLCKESTYFLAHRLAVRWKKVSLICLSINQPGRLSGKKYTNLAFIAQDKRILPN